MTAATHTYTPRGVLRDLFACRASEVLVAGPAGTGKAQPYDATVWTPTGPVPMGSLQVGDEVLTPAGRARVRAIHEQGARPVHRLTFTGGDSTECTGDHLWALGWTGGGHRDGRRVREMRAVRSVDDILGDYQTGWRRRPKYFVPQAGPADFDPRPVPIPAYTLGVLLGDGHLHKGRGTSFTSADPEMAERVRAEMAGRYRLTSVKKSGTVARTYRIVADGWRPTRPSKAKRGYIQPTTSGKWAASLRTSATTSRYIGSYGSPEQAQAAIDAQVAPTHSLVELTGDGLGATLDEMGLEGRYSWEKFVPERYKRNTADVRVAVLRGLMDTDGTVDVKTGTPSFTSTSPRLAQDVKEIVESLGGICRITTKQPLGGRLAYTCWIRHAYPAGLFNLRRKAERTKERTKYPVKRMLLSIEPAGVKQCRCIEVDDDAGLYLTDHFIVTHNSMSCLEKMHMAALNTPGMRGLVVRKTLASLGSTALVTFRERVAAEAIASGMVHFFSGSPQKAAQYEYANGSVIVVGGLDKATRIMSSEFDLAYAQEATELVEDDWEAITTRLRNGRMSFQQLLADCNPAQPTHWLKARCDRGATVMLESRHEDNPVLFDEDGRITVAGASYMAKLDALTGVRQLRLRRGLWAAAEGLVYDEWDPTIHLVDRFKVPDEWTRWWSVDFGYVHPMVIQCWAEDGDGRLFLYRELYRTRRTVDQHAADILAACTRKDYRYIHPSSEPRYAYHGRIWTEPKPRAIFADHDAEGRAVLERELGISTTAARKAVTDGIQAVQKRIRPAGDGKPRLFICRDAVVCRDEELAESRRPTCTAEELLGYVWDTGGGRKPKEAPVKIDDDGADALRYVVAGRDLSPRPRVRFIG